MKKLLLLLSFISTAFIAKSQTFFADSSFNSTGIKVFNVYNTIDRGFACVAQADLKLVTVGLSKNSLTNDFELCFIRLQPNGDLDSSFGTNGITKVSMGNQQSVGGMMPRLKIDPLGRFVAVNSGKSTSGTSQDMMMCRLDSSGQVDAGFNSGNSLFVDMTGAGTQPDLATDFSFSPSGSIYAVGVTRTGTTPLDNDFAVIKVRPNGTLDANFGTGGKKLYNPSTLADFGHGIAVQDDGKVVFGGTGGSKMYVMRIDSAGNYDTTFNHTGILKLNFASSSDMVQLGIDDQGRIVTSGMANTDSSVLVRLLSNGTYDSTFGVNGIKYYTIAGKNCNVGAMELLDNGNILIGGSAQNGTALLDFYAAQFDSSGAFDLNFNTTGYCVKTISATGIDDNNGGVCMMGDGRIFLAGTIVVSSAINEDIGFLMLRPDNFSVNIPRVNDADITSIYPNPSSGKIYITSKKITNAIVCDALGKTVRVIKLAEGKNEINIESLLPGVYFLKSENNSQTIRLIKQ